MKILSMRGQKSSVLDGESAVLDPTAYSGYVEFSNGSSTKILAPITVVAILPAGSSTAVTWFSHQVVIPDDWPNSLADLTGRLYVKVISNGSLISLGAALTLSSLYSLLEISGGDAKDYTQDLKDIKILINKILTS